MKPLNWYIDHTNLKPGGGDEGIRCLCTEAAEHGFKAVCVLPTRVALARRLLEGTPVLVSTALSFPYGQDTVAAKTFLIADALANGAQEIDIVMNYAKAACNDFAYVDDEMAAIKKAAGTRPVKLILETSELSDDQIVKASRLCVKNGIDYVKTSTGTSSAGASPRLVALIKEAVGDKAFIKASGGIKTRQEAELLIAAGADRLGTSKGVALVTGVKPDPAGY